MINLMHRLAGGRLLAAIAALALSIGGLFAFRSLPVDAFPDPSPSLVQVFTETEGLSPEEVERYVTYPIETAMSGLPKVDEIRSTSNFGLSVINIYFEDGTDVYFARQVVGERLGEAADAIPDGFGTPKMGPISTGLGIIMYYRLVDETGERSLVELREIADWMIKYPLQSVEGVTEVLSLGGFEKQYQVRLDPDQLTSYDLSVGEVIAALESANRTAGAQFIEIGAEQYTVRGVGLARSLDDLRETPVKTVDGRTVRVNDLGEVAIGGGVRQGLATANGEGETVAGLVLKLYGTNTSEVIENAQARFDEINQSLPDGVKAVPYYDQGTLVKKAAATVTTALWQGALLVAVIVFLFLGGWRPSLVVVMSIPFSVGFAFVAMNALGIGANLMTLGGVAIAIGMMVDGAIVMVENVHKHMERTPLTPENRWAVMSRAAGEVGPALFFSLMIITVSFLPVFTLEAQEGKLFAPLAFTKTYAMAAAAGLAITLVPVLMGYFIRGKVLPEHRNPINRLLIALYRPIIGWALRRPALMLAGGLVVLIIGFWPANKLGSEFMPPLDEGDLMYMPTTYPGISIGKARQILQQTDKLIASIPEVETVFGKIGRADTATDPAPLTMIETFIQFKPRDQWRPGMTPESLRRELDRTVRLPGLTNAWVMPIKTRIDMLSTGIKTPVGIKVAGPDLAVIQGIGEELERVLTDIPGTASAFSERVAGGRYIKVDIQREAAARFGLNIADIQSVVRTAIGGMNVANTVEGLERYPINLRYPQGYRDSVEQMRLLPMVTPNGQRIALADVADIRIDQGPPMIKSENARINGWTLVDIEGRDLGSWVREAQSVVQEQVDLPAGYSLTWSGQYEYMQRAKERLTLVVPLTLAIIIILLYLNFRNLTEVGIILGTLPFGMIGGIWLMYLLGYNLSVAVAVGFIALAGVAVEIGVLMLVYLNQSLHNALETVDHQSGQLSADALRKAISDGAAQRVRPIMMTFAAIVAGLVPIMLGSGTGSEVMQRIAGPMIGGMVTTLILTLLLIPVIFYLWQRARLKKIAKKGTFR